ncbi:MAG: 3-hydroxyacyl-CoA dehydrogenase [Paracoccus sp. (in: a-proteobacteria)]|uniref:3-hydroxyacyl-CoA dehydrogenase n=1 Tax=Paracoccus sp. TaxID=267 RepID=UPI004058EB2B
MSRSIAVIGCGLIGRAWSIVFARAGCDVRLWDPVPAVRDALPGLLEATIQVSGDDPDALQRIQIVDTLQDALAGAEWVQENGPEQLDIKRDLYAQMDAVAAPDTILASSSSALVASSFAAGLAGRSRILVAHPVNPPHVIPVVELCPAPDTAPEVVDRAEALMRDVAQVPVRMTREVDGFVLNRLQAVVLAEALSLIEQGIVTPQGLDDTMAHGLGRPWTLMGPMATINLNAPGGVADYLNRYGPTMARLSDSAARGGAFTASAAQMVAEAMPSPAEVPVLSMARDRRLAALTRHLNAEKET